MESSLSQTDRKSLGLVFVGVLDPTLARYLDEAKRCVEIDACRAAVVLTWCALVHHLHRQVEMMGFDYFGRLYRKEYPNERPSRIQTLPHLREVKDVYLLKILLMMDILHSEEELKTLNDLRQLRNDCAHAEPREVTQRDVLHWFEKVEPFVIHNPGADRDYRSPHYIAGLIEDLKYELPIPRVRGLIEGVREIDLLPLLEEFIRIYFDDDSSEKHRERVQLFWRELPLDDYHKIQANQKIARKLDRTPSPSRIQVRQLVFWPELGSTEAKYGRVIVSNLLSEFERVVDSGETTEDDVDILRVMKENAAGPNRRQCEQLHEQARHQIKRSVS